MERETLESALAENRDRLGWFTERSSCSAAQLKQLDTHDARSRLGWTEDARDLGSKSARATVEKEREEGRCRLGWTDARTSIPVKDRTAAHRLVQRRAAGLGFVSQFGYERDSTPKSVVMGLHAEKVEERARLGMVPEPASTNWRANKKSASLRKWATESAAVSNGRLYADEPRTHCSQDQRSLVNSLAYEGRARLGMAVERTLASNTQRENSVMLQQEGRARLGLIEERSHFLKADRVRMVAQQEKNYARLGMFEDRDAPTQETRTLAARDAANSKARVGMAMDGVQEFSLRLRKRGSEARREDRHKMGQESSRTSEAVRLEGKGRVLTPRRPFHSTSWHWGDFAGSRIRV
eukprot:CAMPEP_0115836278 /NCGR_PEP_ID=MMETSP0287-20121206/4626_1 /TAXON_ID=412157 /ORGANISM="Chrysochromulina rotalis, Strain UIO044" /LENGTH=351 /DNA_ID=CAMNT_0003289759 /DNA_START=226 /DNA_END=1281 /DNA_ORIENTATION=-